MLENIIEIDKIIFVFISKTMKNTFFDIVMPVITDLGNWIWLFIAGWLVLFIFGGRRGKLACIAALAAVLIADNFNSYILKPFFGRVRPNILLEGKQLLKNATGHVPSPSFPSGHATNIFTAAMVYSKYYIRYSPICFLIAFLVGFSRIYVGVHYPLDIVGGAIFGILWALMIIWITNKVSSLINNNRKDVKNYG